MFTKVDIQFPKPYHFARSEKYETFCVSSFSLAPKMVVRQASPGKIILVLV